MGPNLAAYLISVHMGFRTLFNNRAGEIMSEFGKLKKNLKNLEAQPKNC